MCVWRDLGAVICLVGPAALLYDVLSDVRACAPSHVCAASFEPRADHIHALHATSNRANKNMWKTCLNHLLPLLNLENIWVLISIQAPWFAGPDPGNGSSRNPYIFN